MYRTLLEFLPKTEHSLAWLLHLLCETVSGLRLILPLRLYQQLIQEQFL